MRADIKVHVVNYGRKHLYMRYRDPVTGKAVTRTTGKSRRRDAERVAAKWDADLQEGRYKSPLKVSWIEFRHRYEDEVLSGLASKTVSKVDVVFGMMERFLNPQKLSSLTAGVISRLQNELRKEGLAETTIKGHMAHLKAALNWGKSVGLLHEVPKITMPKRAKNSKMMKGRPNTGEEFERLLAAVTRVVNGEVAESWKHFLRGLWWSGLRLEESLHLYWID